MNQVANSQQQTLNCKIPIKVLSIISLVFTALGSIDWLLIRLSSCIEYVTNHGVDIGVVFGVILFFLIYISSISPIILFNIYIFKLFKKPKARFVLLIVFVLYVAAIIVELFLIRGLKFPFPIFGYSLTQFIYNIIIVVVPFVLITISVLKGFNQKVLLVVGISILLFMVAVGFIKILGYYPIKIILYWCGVNLGTISFYIALLLFGLKNQIPAVISSKSKNINKFNPAQALKTLKNDFELGIITEEEYQAQRAEIISKL